MAHGAGALTSQFEELVRLGLVEMPSDIAVSEALESAAGSLDTIRLTSVELEVPVLSLDLPEVQPQAGHGGHWDATQVPDATESADADAELAVQAPPGLAPSALPMLSAMVTMHSTPPQVRIETLPDVVASPFGSAEASVSTSPHVETLFRALAEVVTPAKPQEPAVPASVLIAEARAAASRRRGRSPGVPGAAPMASVDESAAAPELDAVAPQAAAPADFIGDPVADSGGSSGVPPALAPMDWPEPAGTAAPRQALPQARVRERASLSADHVRVPPQQTEDELLQQVRGILVDVLRLDGPLVGTFSAVRVRTAKTQKQLIAMVWDIERQRTHVRRSRPQLFALERARELLGMGNTLVAWDSQPSLPDESGG